MQKFCVHALVIFFLLCICTFIGLCLHYPFLHLGYITLFYQCGAKLVKTYSCLRVCAHSDSIVNIYASPVIRIVKLFTQHVVRGDYWVPTNCSLTVNGGVASLIAWLDHSCQKTEVGGKQEHAPCRRILLQ